MEAEGIDAGPPAEVGFGDGISKPGVMIASVAAGNEDEEGVEACSVASRSGVGADAGVKSPHPNRKISTLTIQKSLILFIIQFNRLKIKFLTG